ncbi:MAG: RecQ family ATP-dependent DNA helicase [Anaerolineales bacterium]|nr:RecQ family ATP-dependent DNA helicase [Anaerolineales bacterium]
MESQPTNAGALDRSKASPALLPQLGVTLEGAPNLPPELRDQLLAFAQNWGAPEEQLQLALALRAVHGPLLYLLDYQAQAHFKLGQYPEALELIERRQRRSASILTQVREALCLFKIGHSSHARAIAVEVARSYQRNSPAICGAAEVFTQLGDVEAAHTALQTLLGFRPGDFQATLALIWMTLVAEGAGAADPLMQRLGAGIPPGIGNEELRRFRALAEVIGRTETALAAQLELDRRRNLEQEKLLRALQPFTGHSDLLLADPAALYRLQSGPESIPVSRDERRRIEIEAIRLFGFDRLRGGQVETMATVLRGESILAVMPTGGGKSLCYQLPALMLPRATLVISPLIALMKDQVEGMPIAAQARATFINSTLSDAELSTRMAAVERGDYKMIYAAPERLRQRSFLRALRQVGLDLFVVDEAHCVAMWGHDFRPDYLFIEEARRELGSPPALAMTATAPPQVRDEIVDYISGDDDVNSAAGEVVRPRVLSLDIFRPNLHLSAIQFQNEDEKLEALLKFVAETSGSGIIYVNSRHKAEMLALALRQAGVRAEAYHAGLADRSPAQDRFMSDQTRVVVATIAFGMGIDKADIRFIVHFHPSRSLDAYYQEVGRAGRDGRLSQGILFYSANDWANLRRWARADEQNVDFLERVYAAICAQLAPPATETAVNPSDQLPAEEPATRSGPVDARRLQQVINTDETGVRVAVSLLERADLLSRGFDLPQELTLTLPKRISDAARTDRSFARLLKGLALGPEQTANFAIQDIARFMRWPIYEVELRLLDWQATHWIQVKGGKRAMYVELPPAPPDIRARIEALITHAAAVAQRRIDDVVGYATAESCRHGYISAHFGSPPRTRCEVCDNCTGVRPNIQAPERPAHLLPDDADIEPLILDALVSLPRSVGRSGLARILVGALRAPVGPDKARHFGALKGLGEGAVMAYIDDMVEDARMRQYERQGYLVLTPTVVGRAQAEAWLAEHPELSVYGEALAGADGDEPDAVETSAKYTALQKALWLWRRRIAEELGQPAYVVMSNELMLRIAELRPQNQEALRALPGIGDQRLQHYGASLLDLVKLYPAEAGDNALLAAQRSALVEAAATAKAAAGQIRETAAAYSPQLERRVFMRLQELRQKRAVTDRIKPYQVASDGMLREIARRLPGSLDELVSIPGFRSSGLMIDANQVLTAIAALRTAEPGGAQG